MKINIFVLDIYYYFFTTHEFCILFIVFNLQQLLVKWSIKIKTSNTMQCIAYVIRKRQQYLNIIVIRGTAIGYSASYQKSRIKWKSLMRFIAWFAHQNVFVHADLKATKHLLQKPEVLSKCKNSKSSTMHFLIKKLCYWVWLEWCSVASSNVYFHCSF